MSPHSLDNFLSLKERKEIRDRKIRSLYKNGKGLSMDEIVFVMKNKGSGVSKTTVFFAINGRRTKKSSERRRIKNKRKNNLKNNLKNI